MSVLIYPRCSGKSRFVQEMVSYGYDFGYFQKVTDIGYRFVSFDNVVWC